MRGTVPILLCDDESGCPEWTLNDWEMGVSNWKEVLPGGWEYDPYKDRDHALCPEHANHPDCVCGGGRMWSFDCRLRAHIEGPKPATNQQVPGGGSGE